MRYAFLVLLSAVLIGCGAEPPSDEAAIRGCFAGYVQALSSKDGTAAARFVDRRTHEYYHRMRDLALHGTAETVRTLATSDKLVVLWVRHDIPVSTLQEVTGKAWFACLVDKGFVASEGSITDRVGEVSVSGETAVATFLFEDGTPSYEVEWVFRKEEGSWRIDLTSLFPHMEEQVLKPAMKREAARTGKTEDEILLGLLDARTGNKPKDTIWKPLVD